MSLSTASVLLVALAPFAAPSEAEFHKRAVVIANRGSADLSVINVNTDTVAQTVALPAGANTPEPMYVFDGIAGNRVFVGDRANNRVVVFRNPSFEVEATVDVGAGVFHMWGDRVNGNLWVNCDVDNTVSVVDMKSLAVVATIPVPADLVALGGKPHDVFVSPLGKRAWVTMIGVDGPTDWIVEYDAKSFQEVSRAEIGDDPHVSFSWREQKIYAPCQGSGQVFVLEPGSLATLAVLDIPGAHGAIMSHNGRRFYTANLPGGGTDALWVIRTKTDDIVGSPTNTPVATPHNLALTPRARKLYVTHSGATADQVTVYTMTKSDPTPVFKTTITVGTNPFGLAFVR